MTRAPENLLAVRQLLLTHLNVDKDTVRAADLEPAEVGIVGNPAHRGGYHCGSDRVVPNDYSVVESSRDRAGLDDNACGLDVGLFRVATPKGTFDLPHYSRWLVAQCAAGTPDTRDIREVIYSPDGKVVRRWDRLGKRSSGDSSHLFHTHKSYFRDAIRAGRDQTAVVRRYLTTIGLIKGDDMLDPKADPPVIQKAVHDTQIGRSGVTFGARLEELGDVPNALSAIRAGQEAILGAMKGLDTRAILDRINAVAQDEAQRDTALAAKIDQLDQLIAKWQSGELTAEQVLAKLRDLLPAGTTPVGS